MFPIVSCKDCGNIMLSFVYVFKYKRWEANIKLRSWNPEWKQSIAYWFKPFLDLHVQVILFIGVLQRNIQKQFSVTIINKSLDLKVFIKYWYYRQILIRVPWVPPYRRYHLRSLKSPPGGYNNSLYSLLPLSSLDINPSRSRLIPLV